MTHFGEKDNKNLFSFQVNKEMEQKKCHRAGLEKRVEKVGENYDLIYILKFVFFLKFSRTQTELFQVKYNLKNNQNGGEEDPESR